MCSLILVFKADDTNSQSRFWWVLLAGLTGVCPSHSRVCDGSLRHMVVSCISRWSPEPILTQPGSNADRWGCFSICNHHSTSILRGERLTSQQNRQAHGIGGRKGWPLAILAHRWHSPWARTSHTAQPNNKIVGKCKESLYYLVSICCLGHKLFGLTHYHYIRETCSKGINRRELPGVPV